MSYMFFVSWFLNVRLRFLGGNETEEVSTSVHRILTQGCIAWGQMFHGMDNEMRDLLVWNIACDCRSPDVTVIDFFAA